MNQPSPSVTDRLNEAIALHQDKRYDRAAAICETILAAQPNNSDALHILGLTRSSQRDLNTAIDLIQKAISLNPQNAAYHHNLGGLNRQLGRMERATQCFLNAIGLKPDYGEAYQALSELGAFAITQPPDNLLPLSDERDDAWTSAERSSSLHQWLTCIERQLSTCQSPQLQSYFHFAAAKLCDRLEDYDRAFEHYQQGNQTAGVTCDLAAYRTLVADSLYVFTADFRAARQHRKPWDG